MSVPSLPGVLPEAHSLPGIFRIARPMDARASKELRISWSTAYQGSDEGEVVMLHPHARADDEPAEAYAEEEPRLASTCSESPGGEYEQAAHLCRNQSPTGQLSVAPKPCTIQ